MRDLLGNEINCAPHYYSTMSYDWDGDNFFFYSDRERMVSVNPSNITEQNSFPDMDVSLYSGISHKIFPNGVSIDQPQSSALQTDFDIFHSPDGVDWNLNSQLESSNLAISGPLSFAPKKSCPVFAFGRQALYEQPTVDDPSIVGSFDLVRAGKYMYAVYIRENVANDGFGTIYYRRALLGDQSSSSCLPGKDNPLNYETEESDTTGCLNWQTEVISVSSEKARHLSTYWWDNRLYVAYLSDTNEVKIRSYTQNASDGILFPELSQTIPGQSFGKPELALIYGNPSSTGGWTERFVVVYGTQPTNPPPPLPQTNPLYFAHYFDGKDFEPWPNFGQSTGPFSSLIGPGSPSLVAWPDPHNTQVSSEQRLTCGVFPHEHNFPRFYCFDPENLIWEDKTESAFGGPNEMNVLYGGPLEVSGESPIELAFRYTRLANGAPLSPEKAMGNFQLTIPRRLGNNKEILPAELWISRPIDLANSPLQWSGTTPAFRWQDYFTNEWLYTIAGTNLPMYEDRLMGGMFALSLDNIRETHLPQVERFRFYPHIDGTPNLKIWSGSDFRVMEEFLCYSIPGDEARGQAVVPCVYDANRDGEIQDRELNVFD